MLAISSSLSRVSKLEKQMNLSEERLMVEPGAGFLPVRILGINQNVRESPTCSLLSLTWQ